MTILNFIQNYGLQLANTALILGCAISCYSLRRESFEQRSLFEAALKLAAERDVPAAFDDRELRRMVDRRMSLLEKRMILLVAEKEKARRIPVAEEKFDETPLNNAVQMAHSGASANDLVRDCGLNMGEAQLVLRLHAASRVPMNSAAH